MVCYTVPGVHVSAGGCMWDVHGREEWKYDTSPTSPIVQISPAPIFPTLPHGPLSGTIVSLSSMHMPRVPCIYLRQATRQVDKMP